MKLTEILNRKVSFSVVRATPGEFITAAVINNRKIVFSASDNSHLGVWSVSFHEIIKHKSRLKPTYALTGSGGELQVFSMVIDSLKEFISRYHPSEIYFTAEKDDSKSRGELYHKLLSRFKMPGYSLSRHAHKDHDSFTLKAVDSNQIK